MNKPIDHDNCEISDQLKLIERVIKSEPSVHFYRHAIFSLITIKYISDVFDLLSHKNSLSNVESSHLTSSSQANHLANEHWPDDLTKYHHQKALWIPQQSHWSSLYCRICESQPYYTGSLSDTGIPEDSIAQIIDDALLAIEDSNFLKQGIFYPISRYPLDDDKLRQLVHIFADLDFTQSIKTKHKSNLECITGFRYVYEKYSQMFPEKHSSILQIDQVLELIR